MSRAQRTGPLSSDELAHLADASLGNSVVLIADARALLERGSAALAYSIAIVAAEEFGKCQLAVGAIGRLDSSDTDYWRGFWKTFYGHGPKLARAAHLAVRVLTTSDVTRFVAVLEPALREQRRERGLYVDIVGGRPVTPDEEITVLEATETVAAFGSVIDGYASIFDGVPLEAAIVAAHEEAKLMREALMSRDPARIRLAWEATTGRRLDDQEVRDILGELGE